MAEGIEFIFPPQPGSADWADGLRTAQDVIDKSRFVIWCDSCRSWFHFERDESSSSMLAADGQICDCGSKNGFIGSSIRSERTWDKYTKPPTKKKR